ncbi:autotransporter outer membrane beta-barrel domain-containing protein [Xinfangfangia sp. CPCC 101601]|uniref:Autotransporter outer membrane beta-barrel domain-containing protein n=1 Tax=Pseudogemmobacter lacusdianii TaxID=3069608 RepID=A0ABU0W275_9RHOB|nr:autotransporter outer membrane beta-barrel domain-containing protein [Xinfangfangia sp. CPCC 101601]MDQ2068120.1 autotransporter outer membrane beta-barrel domain-containing protein [Xinfangfangia sp. CPCC 101601]
MTVSKSALTVSESGEGNSETFTVVLNSQPTASVSVAVASSAVANATVAPAALTFTSSNWNVPQTVTVTGVNDLIDNAASRLATVSMVAASGDANYEGIAISSVAVTVTDDNDAKGVTVSKSTLTVSESGAGNSETFTVVLNSQPTADVSVAVASSAVANATVAPAALTFTSANWNVPQTVTVTGVNDLIDNAASRLATVSMVAASGDANYEGIAISSVAVTVTDDNDAKGVTVSKSTLTVSESGAGNSETFTVVLNSQPTANVSVAVASSAVANATVAPAALTFTSANWNVPQTVTVTGVNDLIDNAASRNATVSMVAASGDANYEGIAISSVAVTVTDDNDAKGVTVSKSTLTVSESGAGNSETFTVVLNSQPTADVSVAVASSAVANATVAPAALTFTSSNWNVPQTVTVTGVNDLIDNAASRLATVSMVAASGDANYEGIAISSVAVTVTDDNDAKGVTVSKSTLTVSESGAGNSETFTVVLNSQPTADVSVAVASSAVANATVAPAALTFTSANWNVPQTVTVTGVNDLIDNAASRLATVSMVAASGDANYEGIAISSVAVTVTDDNDAKGVTVSKSTLTVSESGAGNSETFTVVLNSQPTADVSVAVASSAVADATVAPAALTFTPSNWNVPQTVTVTGVDDLIDNAESRNATVSMVAASGDANYEGIAISSVAVTVNDDNDAAGISVTPSALTMAENETRTFQVALLSQPAGDVRIVVSSIDVGTAAVSGAVANELVLTFNTANWATAQQVTVTGVDDSIPGGGNRSTTVALSLDDPASYPVEPSDVTVTVKDEESADEELITETFEQVTGAFIGRRMERMMSAEPSRYRFDRRRAANGPPEITVSTKGGVGDFALSYGRTTQGGAWHSWAEAEFTVYKDSIGSLDARDGRFGIVSLGADYLLSENVALGVMVQLDTTSEETLGFSDVSGTGWMVGPYLSMQVAPELYFSARAAWGSSTNDASVDIGGSMYSGNFKTDRSLARAMLYGTLEMGQAKLTPSAEVSYMRESQQDYTVSDGVVTTAITGAEAELWQLAMAADIEMPLSGGQSGMIFFARPQLAWAIDSSGFDAHDGATGSLELGMRTGAGSYWKGEFAIGYDGIGQSDFEAFSARASMSIPF